MKIVKPKDLQLLYFEQKRKEKENISLRIREEKRLKIVAQKLQETSAFQKLKENIPKINLSLENLEFPVVVYDYENSLYIKKLYQFYSHQGWSCKIETHNYYPGGKLFINFPSFFKRIWNKILDFIF